MKSVKKRGLAALALLLVLAFASLLLQGCTAEEGFDAGGEPELSDPAFVRTPPLVQVPELGAVQETYNDGVESGFLDYSNIRQGYIAASFISSKNCKVRIIKGTLEDRENSSLVRDYSLDNDGTVNYYPLAMGNGIYTFILYRFREDRDGVPTYDRVIVKEYVDVSMESEFAPFLIPTRLVRYTPESACVQKSYEIAEHCATDLEVVQQIYAWITGNVTYDKVKAERVAGPTGYEPFPDNTLAERKGICFDYASLAAAMLRANGIPTKLIIGYVYSGGDSIPHAWNMVYLKEAGWIAVELAVNTNDWTRIDATFGASGGGSGMGSFIGDGTNYTDVSEH